MMVINLGERTMHNFGNVISAADVDMLVGVSDITTGMFKVNDTYNNGQAMGLQ